MSIRNEIKGRIADGRLVEFETGPPISVYRPVFLVPRVNAQIVGPWQDGSDDAESMPYVRADLENFIMNGHVTAAFKRGPQAGFRRLSTKKKGIPKVWEMRVTAPRVQYRLIGMFAETDVFVGLEIAARDLVDFELEIENAKSLWGGLFGEHQPVRSERVHDYISERVAFLRE